MTETEVSVQGAAYAIGRLNGKQQFHISRRLAPFLGSLAPLAGSLKGVTNMVDAGVIVIPAIAETLSKLSDEDCDYVIDLSLSVVRKKQDTGWVKLTNATGGLMFPLEMPEMLQLTYEVVRVNLAGFFPTDLLATWLGPTDTTSPSPASGAETTGS